ncbi:MAG: hypothetical protein LBC88_09405 [Spirochaetaceae bacterium]|nr:hypothetical protein [Spirochaetaceae bacterium]
MTGKASIYVEQDFWAQVPAFNVVQDLISGAEDKLKRKGMRINENRAIGLFKERLVRLMMEGDHVERNRLFGQPEAEMRGNIVPIRASPGRPRRWQYFNKYQCSLNPSF